MKYTGWYENDFNAQGYTVTLTSSGLWPRYSNVVDSPMSIWLLSEMLTAEAGEHDASAEGAPPRSSVQAQLPGPRAARHGGDSPGR